MSLSWVFLNNPSSVRTLDTCYLASVCLTCLRIHHLQDDSERAFCLPGAKRLNAKGRQQGTHGGNVPVDMRFSESGSFTVNGSCSQEITKDEVTEPAAQHRTPAVSSRYHHLPCVLSFDQGWSGAGL